MDVTKWLIPSSSKDVDGENVEWTALRSADQQRIAAQQQGAPLRQFCQIATGFCLIPSANAMPMF